MSPTITYKSPSMIRICTKYNLTSI